MNLVEVLASLPAGVKVSTTEKMQESIGMGLSRVPVARAIRMVERAGYGGKVAERNGRFIEVYSGGSWFPWRAFEIVRSR